MRLVVSVLAVLGFFIVLSLWSAHYLDESATKILEGATAFEELAKDGQWAKAEEKVINIQEDWMKVRNSWAVIVDHAEIDHIELSLTRLVEYTKTKATPDTLAEVAQFKELVEHIPRKELLNLHNVF